MAKTIDLSAAVGPTPARLPALGLCMTALIACILFGGNTMTFSTSDAVAEALCAPALIAALARLSVTIGARPAPAALNAALLFCLCVIALLLAQLVPLPPSIWSHLPGRPAIFEGYRLANVNPPWLGLSLSPAATRQSLFSLIPGLAIFLLTVQMNWRQRKSALATLVFLAVVSVVLGLLQLAQGAGSPFRFFYYDNTDIVGFFANHNHLGVLFYLSFLIAGVWGLSLLIEVAFNHARARRPNNEVGAVAVMLFVVALTLVIGAVLTQSRAVILITAGTGALVLALTVPFAGPGRHRLPVAIMAIVLTLGLAIGINFTAFGLAARLREGLSDSIRGDIARATWPLISEYFPIGSGFGTFLPVYGAHETPVIAQVAPINRAHNDFLEWMVEGSVPAGLLIALGIGWTAWMAICSVREKEGGNFLNGSLRRAAAFGLLLTLVHSTVEYPLRTIALIGVTGLFAGLCVEPFGARAESGTRSTSSSSQRKRRN